MRFLVKYYKSETIIQIMKDIIRRMEKVGVFYTGKSPEMLVEEYMKEDESDDETD